MNRPFFSVVIPTKNRSFLVTAAIRSVLNQSFKDVEVVIADNDDTDQTKRAVEDIRDQRIRYFHTGGLSMPDNWDFAYGKAEGEYILLLEDKQLLKAKSLEKIYNAVKTDLPPVVSWCYDQLRDDLEPTSLIKAGGTSALLRISTEEIIEAFLNYGRKGIVGRVLPRGLNSCIHTTLVKMIRDSLPGNRLCIPVSPDYTLAFLQLAFIDHLMHLDEALVIVRGYKYSTGRKFKLKQKSVSDMLKDFGDESQLYDRVPIKAPIAINGLFNDYEKVRALVGSRLSNHPLNIYNYFFQCYIDIQESEKLGADMHEEEAELRRALSEQDKSLRDSLLVVMNLFKEKTSQLLLQTERAEKLKSKIIDQGSKIKQLRENIQKLKKKWMLKVMKQKERAEKFKSKLNERKSK